MSVCLAPRPQNNSHHFQATHPLWLTRMQQPTQGRNAHARFKLGQKLRAVISAKTTKWSLLNNDSTLTLDMSALACPRRHLFESDSDFPSDSLIASDACIGTFSEPASYRSWSWRKRCKRILRQEQAAVARARRVHVRGNSVTKIQLTSAFCKFLTRIAKQRELFGLRQAS